MELLTKLNIEVLAGILLFTSIIIFVFGFITRASDEEKWNDALINRKPYLVGTTKKKKEKAVWTFLSRDEESLDHAKVLLLKAGYEDIPPDSLYVASIVVAGILSVVAFSIFYYYSMFMTVIAVAISAIFGYRIIFILLGIKAESMQKDKQAGVLVYVEALQVACEAGLSLLVAIERVARHYPSPLSDEFKQAYDEFSQNIKTKRQALSGIVDRVGGEEIKILIDSILQAEETGASIRIILQSVADSIRSDSKNKILARGEQAKLKNFVITWVFQFMPYMYIIIGPALANIGSVL